MSTKRTHTKSRLGCKQCKRRRIKCDETPPRCNNCKKKGLKCAYQEWEDVFRSVQFLTPAGLPAPILDSAPENSIQPPGTTETVPAFTMDDLCLHYHFITHTSLTMDFNGECAEQLWQREVPRIAQQYTYLMHAILAFAAVHRIKTEEEQVSLNERLARHHYDQALSSFRQTVGEFSGEQGEAVLCFGLLINFISVNLEFDQVVIEQGCVIGFTNFCTVLRNSVQMLIPLKDSLTAGPVISELHRAFNVPQPRPIPFDASTSLDLLTRFTVRRYPDHESYPEEAITIGDTLVKLRGLYRLVDPWPSTWARILNWPLRLDSIFFVLLRQSDPIALCILAHWCVLFYNAPKRWYFGERPKLLMLAIARHLHDTEWCEGMRWPLSQTVGDVQFR